MNARVQAKKKEMALNFIILVSFWPHCTKHGIRPR